jgi:hypothetical protein
MPNKSALKTIGEIKMNEISQVEQHWNIVLNNDQFSSLWVWEEKSTDILGKQKRVIVFKN